MPKTRLINNNNNVKKQIMTKYDKNDPDIIFLEKYMKNNTENTREDEESYSKNEHSEFHLALEQIPKNNLLLKQNIKSVYTQNSEKASEDKSIGNLTITWCVEKPTTIPFVIVREKRLMEQASEAQKMMRGGGFSIIGKSSKFCQRAYNNTTTKKERKNTIMVLNSKPNIPRPVSAVTRNNRLRESSKLFETANIKNEFQPNKMSQKFSFQQINLITDPSYITCENPNSEESKVNNKINERPVSAHTVIRQNKQTNSKCVSINYIRPFSNYRRPISAAINAQVKRRNDYSRSVDPKKTKMKYYKYLKDLEHNAQKYVNEETEVKLLCKGNIKPRYNFERKRK